MTTDCNPLFWSDDTTFLQAFFKKLQKRRIPVAGTLEITHRCNLKCCHCYLQGDGRLNKEGVNELETAEWQKLIDEMAERGCLFLLITGGDPLLRNDFADIYRHAKKKGICVTVFTNGTLINDEVAELFAELPPTLVEITLYGATEEVYERITGVQGSFGRCLRGVRKLMSRGIETRLKTILMTHNQNEFAQIEKTARHLGNRHFRFDPLIMPALDGSMKPLGLRVDAEKAVSLEFSDLKRAEEWTEFFQKRWQQNADDRLYPCGAGLTSFHVDPYGILKPCLMAHDCCYDLRKESGFDDGWEKVIPGLRKKKLAPDSPCIDCEAKPLCGYCPPFFKLETGDERMPPDYLCDIGRLRLQTVKKMLREQTPNEL